MFSRIRPEPHLPVALSLLLVLGIGTYEAAHYHPAYDSSPVSYMAEVIKAELAVYPSVPGDPARGKTKASAEVPALSDQVLSSLRRTLTGRALAELDSLKMAPLTRMPHAGMPDSAAGEKTGFSLTVVPQSEARCERLATFSDRRVIRTWVNGTMLKDGLKQPSGYAVQTACSVARARVTLDIAPAPAATPDATPAAREPSADTTAQTATR